MIPTNNDNDDINDMNPIKEIHKVGGQVAFECIVHKQPWTLTGATHRVVRETLLIVETNSLTAMNTKTAEATKMTETTFTIKKMDWS